MKNFYKALFLGIIFLLFSFTFAQDCSILKNHSFTYRLGGENVYVDFFETEQIEYYQKRKYFIKSDIKWVSDCEYYLIVKEITLPNYPFKIGTKLHVVITKIKRDKIYYKSTFDNRTWEGKFKKLKK